MNYVKGELRKKKQYGRERTRGSEKGRGKERQTVKYIDRERERERRDIAQLCEVYPCLVTSRSSYARHHKQHYLTPEPPPPKKKNVFFTPADSLSPAHGSPP